MTTPLFGERTSGLFRLFAPQFAITGLMIVPQARLQRDLRFRRIGLSEATGVVVFSAASVALAFAGLGAAAYVLGMLIGVLIMALGYISGGRPVMPRWHPQQMREVLGFGMPATAAGFAGVTYRNVDYMILGARLPSVIVGFYYRAFTVGVEYERRLSGIVARIAFPIYSRTEDPARRLALRLRIVRVNVVLVYPMMALFIALAPSLMPWLFGPQWVPAVLPAQILAVAGMASCVRNLHGPTVLAAGRPKALFVFCCVETLAYGATVWLASSHGLTLICVAVSWLPAHLAVPRLHRPAPLHGRDAVGLRSSATWVQPSSPARRSCLFNGAPPRPFRPGAGARAARRGGCRRRRRVPTRSPCPVQGGLDRRRVARAPRASWRRAAGTARASGVAPLAVGQDGRGRIKPLAPVGFECGRSSRNPRADRSSLTPRLR